MADRISFVQAFLLKNCWDKTAVKEALQSMFDWMQRSEEENGIVARAASRAVILRAMAGEISKHG